VLQLGEALLEVATTVRRYKSEQNLSLGSELKMLQLAAGDRQQAEALELAIPDLMSVCRVQTVQIGGPWHPGLVLLKDDGTLQIGILPN
jgi:valyl-tRNA synthetase